jgi:hypothetical protein
MDIPTWVRSSVVDEHEGTIVIHRADLATAQARIDYGRVDPLPDPRGQKRYTLERFKADAYHKKHRYVGLNPGLVVECDA